MSPGALGRISLRVAVPALIPSLTTIVLAAVLWSATPGDFVPLWTDEVMYWNETAAFMKAGFDAGYITVDEKPAAAAFSHFGPHGIGYASAYGLMARLVGWRPNSQYVWHLVFLPLCAAVWFWVRRRSPGRVGDALLVATFWPLLLYLPTGMTEPVNFGLAFLFAALLEREQQGRVRLTLALVLLIVAAFLRPTWAFILPAVVLSGDASWRRRIAVLAVTGVIGVAANQFQTWTAAPYPLVSWRQLALAAPFQSLGTILEHTWASARAFVSPHQDLFVTIYRAQVLAGLAVLGVLWWRAADRWRVERAAWLVVPVVVVQLAAADVESGRELRIVTPHVFAALLLLAGGGKWKAWVPALLNACVLPVLFPTYVALHDGRFSRAGEIPPFSAALAGEVVFDAKAASPWDNTLVLHAESLQPAIVGVPPGIGVSFTLDWSDLSSPPRSRYVFVRSREEFRPAGMDRVKDVPGGVLYVRRANTAY